MNKVWFITGASRGFGALIAKDALAKGDFVVATGRKAEDVTKAVGASDNLLALSLDVRDEAQAKQAAKSALARFGRIDILLNNAGYGLLGAVEEANAQEIEAQFATNVFGLLNITRAVLPYMREKKSGHIMNISSVGGYASYAGWGIYCATKFAVEALSESLDIELSPLGIRSTVIEPGFFRTDFLSSNSLARTEHSISDYHETVGVMRKFVEGADHQQPGDPNRLSKAIIQLSESKNPPRRLALGSDTVAKIEEKNQFVMRELNEWRELAMSTDFTA